MRIILASASPRRRELLEQIGLQFEVIVSHVEEHVTSERPNEIVEQLALQKAQAVCNAVGKAEEEILIIGSDTVVAVDGRVLGKPADREDAVRMLKMLEGRSHQVYTGVALLYKAPGAAVNMQCRLLSESTEVEFYPMTDEEIQSYVDSGEPMDKAGAYGIQGLCARYIKGISGDYNTVVGLPVGRLYQEISRWL